MATGSANFSKKTPFALQKGKLGMFNSTYVGLDRWLRDVDMMTDILPSSHRYEIGWGYGDTETVLWNNYAVPHEFDAPMVTGNPDDPDVNYDSLDRYIDSQLQRDIPPFLMMCYNPKALQPNPDDPASYKQPPISLEGWGKLLEKIARHFRETGRKIKCYEIWNEPDLDLFYTGTFEEYLEIYRYGVTGLRAGDPDAKVGGPCLAWNRDWGRGLLDFCAANDLPLDFFTFHAFDEPSGYISDFRNIIQGRPEFYQTELVLSEFNRLGVGPNGPDFSQDGLIERADFAPLVFTTFQYLMEQPDLLESNWAQFNDPETFGTNNPDRCGVISNDGHRKVAYNCFRIYADMPVQRYSFSVNDDEDVQGMASGDGHKSAVVVWNNSYDTKEVTVNLADIPFASGRMKVYRIDSDNASFWNGSRYEELVPSESMDVDTQGLRWTGELASRGVVYITVEDGSFLTELAPNRVGTVIRTKNYYFERFKKAYAYFDPRTWIAHMDMSTEDWADNLTGVIVEDMPKSIQVEFEIDGNPHIMDNNSLLGLRVDYMVDGEWVKGVQFHGGIYSADRGSVIPWATRRAADQVVQVDLGSFEIEFADYAPAGWNNGRLFLSFEMQNTGENSRATIYVNRTASQWRNQLVWYNFVTLESGTVLDLTGNGLDATVHGDPDIIPKGIRGSAVRFHGAEDHLTLPNRIQQDFGIAFWVKTQQTVAAGLLDASVDSTSGFSVSLQNGSLVFRAGKNTLNSQSAVNDGRWHHCVVNRSGTTLGLYVDGVLEAEETGASAGDLNAAEQITVGCLSGGTAFYTGAMDELRVYNYALQIGEINELNGLKYLKGRYTCDGGNILEDTSLQQNHIVGENIASVPGRRGNGLGFNGVDASGTIKRNIINDFSISFWINTTMTAPTGPQWYFGNGIIDGDVPNEVFDFGVTLLGGKIAFGIGMPDTTLTSSSDINDGQWHHVAVTRRRSVNNLGGSSPVSVLKIYIDGVLENSSSAPTYSLFSPSRLTIGKSSTNERHFQGALDEIRITNIELTENQILALSRLELD